MADFSEFDRKIISTGYPKRLSDKPVQISFGEKWFKAGVKDVNKTNSLEEYQEIISHDIWRLQFGGFQQSGDSLMELVTEVSFMQIKPSFAKRIAIITSYLGVSDTNMEKGGE